MSSEGQRGLEAVRARKYEEGVKLLDKALESSNSPIWLLARAKALQILKKYDLALEDAEAAYHAAIARGSSNVRKLMTEAQYRRACILFHLRRHADADCCATWSMMLAEGRPTSEGEEITKKVDENGNYAVTLEEVTALKANMPGGDVHPKSDAPESALANLSRTNTDWNTAYVYRCQIIGAMEKLPADHQGRKVTVSKLPPKRPQRKTSSKADLEKTGTDTSAATSTPQAALAERPKQEKAIGPVPVEKLKLRVDFYQNGSNVSISLFTKNVNKDQFTVKFLEERIILGPVSRELAPDLDATDDKSWSTILPSSPIKPEECKYTVTPRKVELSLKKKFPEKWSTWGQEVIGAAESDNSADMCCRSAPMEIDTFLPKKEDEPIQAKPTAAPVPAKGPVYPTSSKSGPKDWDTIGENEPEEDNDVNVFFKSLYKGATPEQQRAMMKSFIESNGTTLSTDWNDVKNRKVETMPPEGVEEKKWDA